MGRVGDLLELVLFGPSRLSSFVGAASTSSGRDTRSEFQFVWASGDRMRVEGRLGNGKDLLFVRDGPRWWRWVDRDGVITNTLGDPSERPWIQQPIQMFMGMGRMAMNKNVEILGHGSIAGRTTISVRLPDRELEIDAEHGVTLRQTYKDSVTHDVSRIEFNVDIPEECFEFEPPSGSEVVAASSREPLVLAVHEAATRVDFPVFAPYGVVVGWPLEASVHDERGDRPERLTVKLREGPIWISHAREPDPESFSSRFANPEAWRHVIRGGVDLLVREEPAIVRLVRNGVHLEIWGEHDNLEQLIAVALALSPLDRQE